MRKVILIAICLVLSNCAYYSLAITTPDGLEVSGRAVVMNESDDVSLSVKSDEYTATFGKQGTDSQTTADLVRDVVESITSPVLPGLL